MGLSLQRKTFYCFDQRFSATCRPLSEKHQLLPFQQTQDEVHHNHRNLTFPVFLPALKSLLSSQRHGVIVLPATINVLCARHPRFVRVRNPGRRCRSIPIHAGGVSAISAKSLPPPNAHGVGAGHQKDDLNNRRQDISSSKIKYSIIQITKQCVTPLEDGKIGTNAPGPSPKWSTRECCAKEVSYFLNTNAIHLGGLSVPSTRRHRTKYIRIVQD